MAECPLWECGAFGGPRLLATARTARQARPLYEQLFAATPEPSYRTEAAAFLADDAGARARTRGHPSLPPGARGRRSGRPRAQGPPGWCSWKGLDRDGRPEPRLSGSGPSRPPPPAAWPSSRPILPGRTAFSTLPNPDQSGAAAFAGAGGLLQHAGHRASQVQTRHSRGVGLGQYLQGRPPGGDGGRGRGGEGLLFGGGAPGGPLRLPGTDRLGPAQGRPAERDRETAEALVISLPQSFEGRQKALVSLMKWRIGQPNERRARTLAEALLAGETAQAGRLRIPLRHRLDAVAGLAIAAGAEALLAAADQTDCPRRATISHASGYALYRLGRLDSPGSGRIQGYHSQGRPLRLLRLQDAGQLAAQGRQSGGPPAQPAGLPGSHVEKARLLFSVRPGLATRFGEFQLALLTRRMPAANRTHPMGAIARPGRRRRLRGSHPNGASPLPPGFQRERRRAASGHVAPPLPRPLPNAVMKSAQDAALPYLLACSVIRQESLWDPRAVSRSGARGLMQLMPATAVALARKFGFPFTPPDCYEDPAWNTRAGCAYLKQLMNSYQGTPRPGPGGLQRGAGPGERVARQTPLPQGPGPLRGIHPVQGDAVLRAAHPPELLGVRPPL